MIKGKQKQKRNKLLAKTIGWGIALTVLPLVVLGASLLWKFSSRENEK